MRKRHAGTSRARARPRGRAVAPLCVLAALCGCAKPFVAVTDPTRVRTGAIDAGQLEASVMHVPVKNMERVERVKQLFQQAGCGSEYLQVVYNGGTPYPNVICTLPGRSHYAIVVGANVDKPDDGNGVIDNWTGAAMLAHLYRSLAASPRDHSFVFVGFGHVLLNEQGARGYLRRLGGERRDRIRAMVDLKGLGLGATSVWSTQADPNLRMDLVSVAKAVGLPLQSVRFFTNVNTDSEVFLSYGIPAITITSFGMENARMLAEPYLDKSTSKIDFASYYDTTRLVSLYLAYLDETLRIREERAAKAEPGSESADSDTAD
ncbi:MAG TPA: M28 family peptidase [Myxococcota bacterium]|nr:M28 family peptidase [Myxococcota bacterium]